MTEPVRCSSVVNGGHSCYLHGAALLLLLLPMLLLPSQILSLAWRPSKCLVGVSAHASFTRLPASFTGAPARLMRAESYSFNGEIKFCCMLALPRLI